MNEIVLEPQRQIAILLRAKELLLEMPGCGLCSLISIAIKGKELEIYLSNYSDLYINEKCIPIFTRENAINYAGARGFASLYWWSRGDIEPRLLFLDWMITELQKQIKHED